MTSEREPAIGAQVRDYRVAAGVNQSLLAKRMKALGHKWTQPTVVAVEKGERPLRFSESLDLADLIGFASANLDDSSVVRDAALMRRVRELIDEGDGLD